MTPVLAFRPFFPALVLAGVQASPDEVLFNTARQNDLAGVLDTLAQGADVNATPRDNTTALLFAASLLSAPCRWHSSGELPPSARARSRETLCS